jgi:hypothetical protein
MASPFCTSNGGGLFHSIDFVGRRNFNSWVKLVQRIDHSINCFDVSSLSPEKVAYGGPSNHSFSIQKDRSNMHFAHARLVVLLWSRRFDLFNIRGKYANGRRKMDYGQDINRADCYASCLPHFIRYKCRRGNIPPRVDQ